MTVPTLSAIVDVLIQNKDIHIINFITSATTSIKGMLLAVSISVIVVFIAGIYRSTINIIYPISVLLKVCPAVAFVPVIYAFVTKAEAVHMYVTALIAFFPIVIMGLEGIEAVSGTLLSEVSVYQPRQFKLFICVIWPYAIYGIVSGIQVAAPLAVVGALVAEIVAGGISTGIGLFILSQQLHPADAFAGVWISAAMGWLAFMLASVLAKRTRKMLHIRE